MLELSLHMLDIAENSVRAGARTVTIAVREERKKDLLSLEIQDDGTGMSTGALEKALDPFYTTKKVRRVGLGLPMLKEAAERTGGSLAIESREGTGTRVLVTFGLSHIDRQPLGDVGLTMVTLIAGSPEVDFVYIHERNGCEYRLDTRDIRRDLGDVPIHHVEVLALIRRNVREGLEEIEASI